MIEPDELIDLTEAARLAHCSKETLARAYRDDKLHCVRPGRKLQTTWNWVETYLEQKDQTLAPLSKSAYTREQNTNAGAWIFLTGETEAVRLQHLHGHDIWRIEQEIDELLNGPRRNGGFGRFILEIKQGFVNLTEMVKTFKSENRK